jgi:putative ABC transport system substrate-binding protein
MTLPRREFITLLGGAAAWPLAARAQQPAVPVVGFLHSGSRGANVDRVRVFKQGLSETGYVEGRNVAIESRWADGQFDQLPAMAADLVRRPVSVIVAVGQVTVVAAKAATSTIPIVFQAGADPVETGLVASLNRPGGNLTGVTSLNLELGPKRLELLRELRPAATMFALLVNRTNQSQTEIITREIRAAANALGLELEVLSAANEQEFGAVFATVAQVRAGGLMIAPDAYFSSHSGQLATLAARYGIPAIYPFKEDAAAGGLMSYGGDPRDQSHQVGVYTGRILKGEKPADLPVQQSTKVELVINLRAAKSLGLTFPITLLGRADEVIE